MVKNKDREKKKVLLKLGGLILVILALAIGVHIFSSPTNQNPEIVYIEEKCDEYLSKGFNIGLYSVDKKDKRVVVSLEDTIPKNEYENVAMLIKDVEDNSEMQTRGWQYLFLMTDGIMYEHWYDAPNLYLQRNNDGTLSLFKESILIWTNKDV